MQTRRALSPKETGIANLTYMLDRAALCKRAALQSGDPQIAEQIASDIAAIERTRELINLYGDPNS
jgi:hypothetical protein